MAGCRGRLARIVSCSTRQPCAVTCSGWVAAAGRVAQHRALWDLPETTLVGPLPPIGQPDYEITYYAANRAIADFGLGPQTSRKVERDLGLSL